jgi:hypothetical protein
MASAAGTAGVVLTSTQIESSNVSRDEIEMLKMHAGFLSSEN